MMIAQFSRNLFCFKVDCKYDTPSAKNPHDALCAAIEACLDQLITAGFAIDKVGGKNWPEQFNCRK